MQMSLGRLVVYLFLAFFAIEILSSGLIALVDAIAYSIPILTEAGKKIGIFAGSVILICLAIRLISVMVCSWQDRAEQSALDEMEGIGGTRHHDRFGISSTPDLAYDPELYHSVDDLEDEEETWNNPHVA